VGHEHANQRNSFCAPAGNHCSGRGLHDRAYGKTELLSRQYPQAGELIAVSYRTSHRSVARLASAASIAAESNGGKLPGTAYWMGSVTCPCPAVPWIAKTPPVPSLLSLPAALRRGPANTQSGMPINRRCVARRCARGYICICRPQRHLVVRAVEIDLASTKPSLAKYTLLFANDWPTTWPSKPRPAFRRMYAAAATGDRAALASLNALAVTSVTGSVIQIAANATLHRAALKCAAATGPSRRGPDRISSCARPSPTSPSRARPHGAVLHPHVRRIDAANYSRFSSAVFVNLPL